MALAAVKIGSGRTNSVARLPLLSHLTILCSHMYHMQTPDPMSASTKEEALAEIKEKFGEVFEAITDGRMKEEEWNKLMSRTGSDTAWEDVVEVRITPLRVV